MRKFEYKTIVIDIKNNNCEANDLKLNELGEDGWEIANVIATDTTASLVVFKKEKPREFDERPSYKSFGDKQGRRPFDSKPRNGEFKPRSDEFKPKAKDMKPRSEDKPWINDSKSDRRPKRF